MQSKLPASSKKSFAIIKDVISMGIVEMPDHCNGSGAPGDTLEYLCNVERNNYDSPDLNDWEVKFHGGSSLLTLFHKEGQPTGVIDKMVDTFGWEKNGQISFRHTIGGKNKTNFIVTSADDKITVTNPLNKNVFTYWEHDVIVGAIAAKLRRLILVKGKVKRITNQVTYISAVAFWDLNLSAICDAIESGVIYIDFDARTTKGKGTSLRNHGTKFRIHVRDVEKIYKNSQIIVEEPIKIKPVKKTRTKSIKKGMPNRNPFFT